MTKKTENMFNCFKKEITSHEIQLVEKLKNNLDGHSCIISWWTLNFCEDQLTYEGGFNRRCWKITMLIAAVSNKKWWLDEKCKNICRIKKLNRKVVPIAGILNPLSNRVGIVVLLTVITWMLNFGRWH